MVQATHMALLESSWDEKCYPDHTSSSGKSNMSAIFMASLLLTKELLWPSPASSPWETYRATDLPCWFPITSSPPICQGIKAGHKQNTWCKKWCWIREDPCGGKVKQSKLKKKGEFLTVQVGYGWKYPQYCQHQGLWGWNQDFMLHWFFFPLYLSLTCLLCLTSYSST